MIAVALGIMGPMVVARGAESVVEQAGPPVDAMIVEVGPPEEAAVDRRTIRTTAYTHTEADHLKYKRKNAIGTTLRYGKVRSAAADWSRFPVGTTFRIVGQPETLYVIDDYGSALVGREVIDLYKPTRSALREWGARNVEIEIVEWGCFEKSLEILEPRARFASHVRRMVDVLRERVPG